MVGVIRFFKLWLDVLRTKPEIQRLRLQPNDVLVIKCTVFTEGLLHQLAKAIPPSVVVVVLGSRDSMEQLDDEALRQIGLMRVPQETDR